MKFRKTKTLAALGAAALSATLLFGMAAPANAATSWTPPELNPAPHTFIAYGWYSYAGELAVTFTPQGSAKVRILHMSGPGDFYAAKTYKVTVRDNGAKKVLFQSTANTYQSLNLATYIERHEHGDVPKGYENLGAFKSLKVGLSEIKDRVHLQTALARVGYQLALQASKSNGETYYSFQKIYGDIVEKYMVPGSDNDLLPFNQFPSSGVADGVYPWKLVGTPQNWGLRIENEDTDYVYTWYYTRATSTETQAWSQHTPGLYPAYFYSFWGKP